MTSTPKTKSRTKLETLLEKIRFLKPATIRLYQFLISELILNIGFGIVFHHFQSQLIWPISAGLIVPVLFSEPFFTGPRIAIVTTVSQVATYYSADHSINHVLWAAMAALNIFVFMCALIAITKGERNGQIFHWISARLGRSFVLGTLSILLVGLEIVNSNPSDITGVVLVLSVVYCVLFLDWIRLFRSPTKQNKQNAEFVTSISPNQILVRMFGKLTIGSRIKVQGNVGSAFGFVAGELSSPAGIQYQIVLEESWTRISDERNTVCFIHVEENQDFLPFGFALEGSTENSLRASSSRKLEIGGTYSISSSDSPLLYQVTGQRLEIDNWNEGSALVSRTFLSQVGQVDGGGYIRSKPELADPYQPIYEDTGKVIDISAEYFPIGTLKGTGIQVGIKRNWESNNGHLAILGMSGMGKTTFAAKMPQILDSSEKFLIIDATSEYRSRLGFTSVAGSAINWTSPGTEVFEPSGSLPVECAKIITLAMNAAYAEYVQGVNPIRRYILIEEAHGMLPEWNFVAKGPNTESVNESCRNILQARKFNITFILVSQRTAIISKSAISQCENYVILRTLDQTSLEYVESVVGADLKHIIPELGKYEAVCVGPIFNSDSPLIVNLAP